MQVTQNTTYQNKTNFKAIPLAQIKVRENINKFTIYEATREDMLLLKKMSKKLEMHKLLPSEAGEKGFDRWKEIIDEAIEQFKNGAKLLIATHKNRPCGVLSYSKSNNIAFINEIASFPISINKKIKYTGTALMKAFFEEAKQSNFASIMLIPSTQIHKNPTGFYKRFHFKELEYSDIKTNLLFAKREDYSLASREIDEKLQYLPEINRKQTPLRENLNLNFLPPKSFKEKILDLISL